MTKIDYNKFMRDTKENYQRWQPPVPEEVLRNESAKIPVSTRVYPEIILALYAYFEQVHNIQASSLSELIYMACAETLNLNEITELPPPETAVQFMIGKGFLTLDNKEAQGPLSKLFHKATQAEQKAYEHGTLEEQAKYWKHRDPEKYESIMKQIEDKFTALMSDLDSD